MRNSPRRRPTVSLPRSNPLLGTQVQVPVHPSKCLLTSLKIDKDRKTLLERKKRVTKTKNKHKEGMVGVD